MADMYVSGKQDGKLFTKCSSNGAWNNVATQQAEAASS